MTIFDNILFSKRKRLPQKFGSSGGSQSNYNYICNYNDIMHSLQLFYSKKITVKLWEFF
nr:MAG TPA: hypothetical protein [Caudoviricetes sp.]